MPLLLASCYVSTNGYLCGLNTPEIYCDKKIREKLLTPVRSIDKWSSGGKSEQARLQDWVECGGDWGGGNGILSAANGGPRTSEEIQAHSKASFDKIQRCMLKKQYEYIGPCYENDISRPQPGCRARRGEPWE